MHKRFSQHGFTVPELLVVISVIAILAALVIVSYNGVQQRGQDSAIQSDLDAVAGSLEAQRVRSTPRNFPSDTTGLTSSQLKASKSNYKTATPNNFIYCVSSDFQSFALIAISLSGNIFMITQDGFQTVSFNEASLASNPCNVTSLTSPTAFVGLSSGTWQSWVSN